LCRITKIPNEPAEGESGVIALAKKTRVDCALDDLDARKMARKEQIKITGTLGVIKIGYELCPIKDKKRAQEYYR